MTFIEGTIDGTRSFFSLKYASIPVPPHRSLHWATTIPPTSEVASYHSVTHGIPMATRMKFKFPPCSTKPCVTCPLSASPASPPSGVHSCHTNLVSISASLRLLPSAQNTLASALCGLHRSHSLGLDFNITSSESLPWSFWLELSLSYALHSPYLIIFIAHISTWTCDI